MPYTTTSFNSIKFLAERQIKSQWPAANHSYLLPYQSDPPRQRTSDRAIENSQFSLPIMIIVILVCDCDVIICAHSQENGNLCVHFVRKVSKWRSSYHHMMFKPVHKPELRYFCMNVKDYHQSWGWKRGLVLSSETCSSWVRHVMPMWSWTFQSDAVSVCLKLTTVIQICL